MRYLPNSSIVFCPVGSSRIPIFWLNPGYAAQELVIVWKYAKPVYLIHDSFDDMRAFRFRSFDWSLRSDSGKNLTS